MILPQKYSRPSGYTYPDGSNKRTRIHAWVYIPRRVSFNFNDLQMPKSKINFELLTWFFESNPDRVFAPADLELLFIQQASEWNLPQSMRSQAFVQMLLNRTKLKEVRLRSRYYASLVRYVWEGKASPMAVAISIKKRRRVLFSRVRYVDSRSERGSHEYFHKQRAIRKT